jgi:hypothetical protein
MCPRSLSGNSSAEMPRHYALRLKCDVLIHGSNRSPDPVGFWVGEDFPIGFCFRWPIEAEMEEAGG